MTTVKRFSPNKTTEFYNKLNTMLYILGLPDFWIEDVKLPKTFVKKYNVLIQILDVIMALFVAMVFLSLFTQSDQYVTAYMVPSIHLYHLILIYRRTGIREILYHLGVLFKEVHNDKEVEKEMIKNVKFFVSLFFWNGIIIQLLSGATLINKYNKGEPLVTIVTAWPGVTDESTTADIVRCIIYVIGFVQYLRTFGSHVIIFATFIGLSHQFKNTQSYFYSLDNIFSHLYLSQKEKEDKFEKAFKAGIKMHETTLWCTKQCQILYGIILNNQSILVSIIVIPILSDSMKPESSPIEKIFPGTIAIIALFFWLCAGSIKVEASKVSDAMYGSGWHNCFGKSSVRVRKLVVIAMTRAQKPVVMKAFNFIELSYDAFWNLIMSAYTTLVIFY